jgi:hypothetical protein
MVHRTVAMAVGAVVPGVVMEARLAGLEAVLAEAELTELTELTVLTELTELTEPAEPAGAVGTAPMAGPSCGSQTLLGLPTEA